MTASTLELLSHPPFFLAHVRCALKYGCVLCIGSGKSTLLSALLGRVRLEAGSVRVKQGLRVGYLEQTAVAATNTTVRPASFCFKHGVRCHPL